MFGLPLYGDLFEDSALGTWNCVSNLASFLWYRLLGSSRSRIMPRSRRRHHSRSKSRSRSHSHERDREPKRRKIESYKSPLHNNHRRSISSESEANEIIENIQISKRISDCGGDNDKVIKTQPSQDQETILSIDQENNENNCKDNRHEEDIENPSDTSSKNSSLINMQDMEDLPEEEEEEDQQENNTSKVCDDSTLNESIDTSIMDVSVSEANNSISMVTPKKPTPTTPRQMQKKLESEKKRQEKQKEKEERERKRQEERDEKKRAKEQEKKEREDLKLREKEMKDKERELKRKEKEEREETKRKEREEKEELKQQERLKRQQEIDEKNREKQKIEEQKLKAAAAFTKFFVSKQPSATVDVKQKHQEDLHVAFMPFQPKSDMRLAPLTRTTLNLDSKHILDKHLVTQNETLLYLSKIDKKSMGKSQKTWQLEEDVFILEDNMIGTNKGSKMKAKYLKFHENNRPAYYGTWRKKSVNIKPKKPLEKDSILNYEVDSDEEWEEEVEGEDIAGSEDEDKEEKDTENDYEVDNDFFVPHGHLSDDEEQDEENITPELRKAKEKLLNNQFEEERKSLQTKRLKTRVIGCVWYDKEGKNVDEAIDLALKPFSIITNGICVVRRRNELSSTINAEKKIWELDKELMPDFLRLVHGNAHSKHIILAEFLALLKNRNVCGVSKKNLGRLLGQIAHRQWYRQKGPMYKKNLWLVHEHVQTEYNHVPFDVPNNWKYSIDVEAFKK